MDINNRTVPAPASKSISQNAPSLTSSTASGPEPQQANWDDTHKFKSASEYTRIPTGRQRKAPKLWQPLSLHRRVLAAYVVLLVILFGAIELIYRLSCERNGIANAVANEYYLWTYGPTAIFTLLSAFWSRFEYRVKQLAPWTRMRQGPTPSSKSLLIDYVSPSLPETIYVAFREQDLLVAFTAIGSLVVKLMIVISTGLLSLQTVTTRQSGVHVPTIDAFVDSTSGFEAIGSMPGYTVAGLQYMNLSYPIGSTDKYAYQSLDTSGAGQGSMFEAVVDGFTADLECHEGGLEVASWVYQTVLTPLADVNESVTLLSGPSLSTTSCFIDVQDIDITIGTEGDKQNFTLLTTGSCQNTTSEDEKWMLLLVGQVLQGNTTSVACPGPREYDSASDECFNTVFTLLQSTSLYCQPRYNITAVRVRLNDTASTFADVTPVGGNSSLVTLPQVTAWDIANSFFDVLEGTPMWKGSGASLSTSTSLIGNVGPAFALVFDRNPTLSVSSLLNSVTLKAACVQLFQMLSAQIAKSALLIPASSSVNGTVWIKENRLVVGQLSTRLLEVLLALLIGLILILFVTIPQGGTVSRDPESIISTAMILKASQRTTCYLRGQGAASLDTILNQIRGCLYWTNDNPEGKSSFQISTEGPSPDDIWTSRKKVSDNPVKWYRPLALRLPVKLCVCLVMIVTIATLEATLHISHRDDGLGSVTSNNYLHYLWSYLPALLMVSIALYYGSLDFSTKVIEPYARLSRSPTTLDRVSVLFLGKMPVSALWYALLNTNATVFLTTLAVGLGSFLTIAVAGVFTTQNVQVKSLVLLERSTWFNTTSLLGTYVQEACTSDSGIAAGLILEGNLSYPQWTYDTLAIPQLELKSSSSSESLVAEHASTLSVRTPAVRVVPNCTIYHSDQITMEIESPESGTAAYFAVDVSGEAGTCDAAWPDNTLADGTFGFLASTYCPNTSFSIVAFWGSLSGNTTTKVSAMMCSESFQQVSVDITFSLPSFLINTTDPPLPDENTISYPSEITFDALFDLPSQSILPQTNSTSGYLDGYFSAAVYGREGVPESYLTDPAQDTTVARSLQHVLSVVRAQMYSLCSRNIENDTSADTQATRPSILNGTITNANRLRLVQQAVATRVLEALLVTMLLCGLISSMLLKTENVLPRNPCSIASMAGFLADSSLVDESSTLLPAGAEKMSEKELLEHLRRHKFQMGWFNGPDGRRFTIDVVDEEKPMETEMEVLVERGRKRNID